MEQRKQVEADLLPPSEGGSRVGCARCLDLTLNNLWWSSPLVVGISGCTSDHFAINLAVLPLEPGAQSPRAGALEPGAQSPRH